MRCCWPDHLRSIYQRLNLASLPPWRACLPDCCKGRPLPPHVYGKLARQRSNEGADSALWQLQFLVPWSNTLSSKSSQNSSCKPAALLTEAHQAHYLQAASKSVSSFFRTTASGITGVGHSSAHQQLWSVPEGLPGPWLGLVSRRWYSTRKSSTSSPSAGDSTRTCNEGPPGWAPADDFGPLNQMLEGVESKKAQKLLKVRLIY